MSARKISVWVLPAVRLAIVPLTTPLVWVPAPAPGVVQLAPPTFTPNALSYSTVAGSVSLMTTLDAVAPPLALATEMQYSTFAQGMAAPVPKSPLTILLVLVAVIEAANTV